MLAGANREVVALPGDCTPAEAASFTVDPRTEQLVQGPSCGVNNLPYTGEWWVDTNLTSVCAALADDVVMTTPTRPATYMDAQLHCQGLGPSDPAYRATFDQRRHAVQATMEGLSRDSGAASEFIPTDYWPCRWIDETTERRPDAAMIATKAAGVALASRECAACAAQYEPDGGFDTCVVSTETSCAPSGRSSKSDLLRDCVVDQDALLAGSPAGSELTEEERALGGAYSAHFLFDTCFAWSSLGQCEVRLAWPRSSYCTSRSE